MKVADAQQKAAQLMKLFSSSIANPTTRGGVPGSNQVDLQALRTKAEALGDPTLVDAVALIQARLKSTHVSTFTWNETFAPERLTGAARDIPAGYDRDRSGTLGWDETVTAGTSTKGVSVEALIASAVVAASGSAQDTRLGATPDARAARRVRGDAVRDIDRAVIKAAFAHCESPAGRDALVWAYRLKLVERGAPKDAPEAFAAVDAWAKKTEGFFGETIFKKGWADNADGLKGKKPHLRDAEVLEGLSPELKALGAGSLEDFTAKAKARIETTLGGPFTELLAFEGRDLLERASADPSRVWAL
ncbi:MAG: hypothetical protein K1X89_25625 [Myxococcaceae bacterium]|nr:hypothetical protein [Myxococcaceae bacterium]